MSVTRSAVLLSTLALLGAATVSLAPAATADPAVAGTYNALTPTRVLDTRTGTGGVVKMPVASGGMVTFSATTGLGTQTVSAVALNITAVTPAASGHLTVYPGGSVRPNVSTVSFDRGNTTADATVVRTNVAGLVSVYNGSSRPINVVADRTGYWTGGAVSPSTDGAFTPLAPSRIRDTRANGGAPAASASVTKVAVTGHGGVPTSNVSAVAITLTAVTPTKRGFLSVAPEPQMHDMWTSDVNYPAPSPGRPGTRANLMLVPVNPDGTVSIYAGTSGTVHELVDVLGWFSDGIPGQSGAFLPTSGYRNSDTRVKGPALAPRSTRKVALFPNNGAASSFTAVAITVTAVAPTQAGYLTVWSGTGARPATSNVNFVPGKDMATTVIVPVSSNGTIAVYNSSGGSTDLVVDVQGFFVKKSGSASTAVSQHRVALAIRQARQNAAIQS